MRGRKRHARHPSPPVRAGFHDAFRFVVVSVDEEAGPPGEVEEEQHVATRQRRHQGFLGIDAGRGRKRAGGTTCGEEEAGTRAPPSNAHSCARL